MKKIMIALLMLVGLNAFAQPGTKNFIDQNYIEVVGKAEMEVAPDQIYLKILIDEKDFKGKSSLEELEGRMLKKLGKIGLDLSKDVVIMDMASNFKNYWVLNKKIYTMKEYKVLCREASAAGKVFQELELIGISNISIDRIEHSDIQKYRREVKVTAIKAAREKAVDLSAAIDQSIGKAIHVQEQDWRIRNTGQQMGANIMIRGTASSIPEPVPEIEFEKIKLESTILAKFLLK